MIILNSQMSNIKHGLRGLMNFFFTLWMAVTYPLHSLFPVQIAATPHKEDRPMHPQEWDHSFSDGNLC